MAKRRKKQGNAAQLKIALACILLLVCGWIAAFVFDVNPLAAKPEDRSLDQLFDDMGVELFSSRTPSVEVLLEEVNGAEIDISDFRGNIVFLNFWATWCPSCVTEMPSMEKLHRKFKEKDFAVVAVSIQDSAAAVKRFFKQNQLTYTALLDSAGKTVPGFGIRAIPTTLLLDKSGRIFGRIMGPREWDSRESVAMFQQLLAEPVTN
ncbi:MAG: TlpA family protein disulfide reductase [bacterium]|nr:TlpA family protein disulfide reductase [bacterium]